MFNQVPNVASKAIEEMLKEIKAEAQKKIKEIEEEMTRQSTDLLKATSPTERNGDTREAFEEECRKQRAYEELRRQEFYKDSFEKERERVQDFKNGLGSAHGKPSPHARGDALKRDFGKPMWDLLEYKNIGDIARVATFGAEKYGAYSWKEVPDARNRYFAAAMRHLAAWKAGEQFDRESGLPHLAHAMCNVMFMSWFDDNDDPEVARVL